MLSSKHDSIIDIKPLENLSNLDKQTRSTSTLQTNINTSQLGHSFLKEFSAKVWYAADKPQFAAVIDRFAPNIPPPSIHSAINVFQFFIFFT